MKFCAKCGTDKKIQRHHLFPKRFFGEGVRVNLCEQHHRELEAIIFQYEGKERKKLSRQEYLNLTIEFISPL